MKLVVGCLFHLLYPYGGRTIYRPLLGAFEKLRKATFSFVIYACLLLYFSCPSVRMEKLDAPERIFKIFDT
jgi:hypothetical protein